MNEILRDIYNSLKKGEVPRIPRVPARPKGSPKKRIKLLAPRKKQVKFMMCDKMHEFLKFWCMNAGIHVGPFINKAIMRELVREIQEREETIHMVQEYYANYFECAEAPDTKEREEKEE